MTVVLFMKVEDTGGRTGARTREFADKMSPSLANSKD